MNNITIIPQMLSGSVKIPPSKSIAHRAIIAAALSKGECTIDNAAMSMDIEATLGGIRALGSKYTYSKKDARLNISAKKSTGRNINRLRRKRLNIKIFDTDSFAYGQKNQVYGARQTYAATDGTVF